MDSITKINLADDIPVMAKGTAPTVKSKVVSLESAGPNKKVLITFLTVAVVAGLVSGFMYAKSRLLVAQGLSTEVLEAEGTLKPGQIIGAKDEAAFTDKAEGIIQPGGIAGEGSHHLVRGDNESQWVYLTSSVIDLDLYVGTKTTIWGETIQGKKAGWLMDVARLKILELNAAEVDAVEPSAAE